MLVPQLFGWFDGYCAVAYNLNIVLVGELVEPEPCHWEDDTETCLAHFYQFAICAVRHYDFHNSFNYSLSDTDCGSKLLNGKRKDFRTVVQTVLQKSPGLQAKYLIKELHERIGLSRSTIYEHLFSMVSRGELFTENARYYLEKPQVSSEKSNIRGTKLFPYELEETISIALKDFKSLGYEGVSILDLANRVGHPPSVVEAPAFRLAHLHGLTIESVSRYKNRPVPTYGLKPPDSLV